MSYKYYEGPENEIQSFNYDDFSFKLKERKDKFEGLIKRKFLLSHPFLPEREVVHLQETKWDDNRRPDHNNTESYDRIVYLLDQIKKHRQRNPTGSVLVHCR